MNLHNEIMNVRCDESNISIHSSVSSAYKDGHRDARDAAAELYTASTDTEINRLRSLLKERERLTDAEIIEIYRHGGAVEAGPIDFARIIEAKSTAKAEAEVAKLKKIIAAAFAEAKTIGYELSKLLLQVSPSDYSHDDIFDRVEKLEALLKEG